MGLETGTYINSLVATNPVHATDDVSVGDDHIRLLKSTIKATFPNITGAMTSTHTELNLLDGVTATTAELNILDGVTSTAAELNILDGVTATASELNILDGVTATAAQLNVLATDGAGAGMLADIAAIADPNADRLLGWDDSASAAIGYSLGAGLETSTTSIRLASNVFGVATSAELQLDSTLFDLNSTTFDADGTTATLDYTTLTLTGGSAVATLSGTEIDLTATTLDFNGAADFSSTLAVASYGTFAGNQSTSNATVRLSTSLPSLVLTETDQATDQQNWRIDSEGGVFRVRAYNDAFTVVSDALRILRTTTTVDEVELNATLLDVNAAADFSSTILAAGVITAKASSSATTGSVKLDASSNPGVYWDDGAASADNGNWLLYSSAGTMRWRAYNDAGSANSEFLTVGRSGTTISQITLAATELQFDGTTLDINATIDADGVAHDINGSTSVTLTGTANAVLALTTSGFNADGSLDLDGGTHNLNGTTSVTLVSSSASVAAIASGNEVDLTGTTIDINGNLDVDGTALDIDGATSLTLHGGSVDLAISGTAAVVTGGKTTLAAGTTSYAPLNIPGGSAPSSPSDGDIWVASNVLYFRSGGSTWTIDLTIA